MSMTPRKTNDSRIAKERMRLGLTQAQLAEKIGVQRAQLSIWERGVCAPKMSNLLKLSQVLGCSIEALIGGQE